MKLHQEIVGYRAAVDGHSNQLQQAVTADFIRAGHFATHLRQSRLVYQSRRDLLLAELPLKTAVRLCAEITGTPRNAVYQAALARRQQAGEAEG